MKKFIPLLLVLFLVLAYIFYQKTSQVEKYEESTLKLNETDSSPTRNKYSISEIEKHNAKEDCWLVVDGKVYDVTSYIADGKHPGGEVILEGCGKDATVLFNTRPGSGTSHSNRARGYLDGFETGDLE